MTMINYDYYLHISGNFLALLVTEVFLQDELVSDECLSGSESESESESEQHYRDFLTQQVFIEYYWGHNIFC